VTQRLLDPGAPAITTFRPFLPAKDFEESKRFYRHLGFSTVDEWDGGAEFALGAATFILQNFYVEQWASNFMMQMVVPDIDAWWAHIQAANLAEVFDVAQPRAPELQPWGLIVAYIFDPAGVLWHVTPG
jgi:catechol 2,3-dioxygenase-like lactoylglutathione lyase family enzyme